MKKLSVLKFLLLSFFAFVLFFIFTPSISNKANASSVIFQDNFDSYANGSFPSKWLRFDPPPIPTCNAQWTVENGQVGMNIPAQSSCVTNIIPTPPNWPTLLNQYIFEVDMRFVSGTDHNLPYIIVLPSGSIIYEVHFQSPGDFSLGGPIDQTIVNVSQGYSNGQTYHIKLIVTPSNIKVLINNVLVREVHLSTPLPLGTIGLRAGVGGDPSSETWFDNIVVTTLDNNVDLNVPLLKQTSDPWKSQIYDSASKWAPTNPTINSWGCALTSGAMVLNYHGINKLPNGTTLNPGTLNSWLKSQKDGYIGTGWVNWLALSRLSKLAKSINNITTFDALQYSRTNSGDKNKLTADINNLIPDILEVPGHFIVAKGINGTTFNINDPFYNRNTLNDGYSNTFLTLGRYSPSNTDLSYIMLNTNPGVTVILRDSGNNTVGESFIQQPLVNDDNPFQTNLPIQILYLPQPQTQEYKLTVSSSNNKTYDLHAYLYDQDGNVNIFDQNGLIGPSKTDGFIVNFDKQNFNNSNNTKIVTFQSLIDDINEAKAQKLISPWIANNLIYLVKDAKKNYDKGKKKIAIIKLNVVENIIKSIRKSPLIKEDAYQILLYDVRYLKNHL